jgi:hypothetical protein
MDRFKTGIRSWMSCSAFKVVWIKELQGFRILLTALTYGNTDIRHLNRTIQFVAGFTDSIKRYINCNGL